MPHLSNRPCNGNGATQRKELGANSADVDSVFIAAFPPVRSDCPCSTSVGRDSLEQDDRNGMSHATALPNLPGRPKSFVSITLEPALFEKLGGVIQ
jgi:hypothetical protein